MPGAERGRAGAGRQYSLVGDAELDEGAVWEAILDPAVAELGELVWIVDLNRQSLDRVVPNIAAGRLEAMFAAAGWQVITLKYGQLLTWLFGRPGGAELRRRIDEMTNPEYQRLLRLDAAALRERLPQAGDGGGTDPALAGLVEELDDATLLAAIRNLGGHDLASLDAAFGAIDDTRPTVIFAYTVKGYRLPTQGHPQNHSALLTAAQVAELARELGADPDQPWARFAPGSEAARACAAAAARLQRDPVPVAAPPTVPADFGRTPAGRMTTQAALGRVLLDLSRSAPDAARRVVTVSPDVSLSTNLAGWVNKVGVWSAADRTDWFADDAETLVHWRERPAGAAHRARHRGDQPGRAARRARRDLVPLGRAAAAGRRAVRPVRRPRPGAVVVRDLRRRPVDPRRHPVRRVAGPGGRRAPVGDHPVDRPRAAGLRELRAGLRARRGVGAARLPGRARPPDGSSAYLRLSTRPVDQTLAAVPADPAARERRRRQVVAGGYLIGRAERAPDVTIAAMGVLLPEALAAAERLAAAGVAADVACVTSPDLLFRALRARQGHGDSPVWILDQVLPADRAAPLVTVLDGHPHTLAFLGGVNQVPAVTLGVTSFGQSGDLADVYRYHGIDADSIVRAALDITRA